MMDLLSLREAYLPEPLPLAKRKRARMNSFHTGFHDVALPFALAPSAGAPEARASASSIRTVTVGPGISPGQPALSHRVAGLPTRRGAAVLTASEDFHLALKQNSRAHCRRREPRAQPPSHRMRPAVDSRRRCLGVPLSGDGGRGRSRGRSRHAPPRPLRPSWG